MNLKLLHNEQIGRDQWQKLVAVSPVATWFQTPAAFDFYQSLPQELSAFAFAVQRESGELAALATGYIPQEKSYGKQLLTRRAILLGGLLLRQEATKEEIVLLLNALKALKVIYTECRNLADYTPWQSLLQENGFAYRAHLNFQVHLADEWANKMSESRNRQIKKAMGQGVQVQVAQTEAQVSAFYQILKRLYQTKVRTPLWTESFFQALVKQGRGVVLVVEWEGKVIGGMACPVWEKKTMYEWFVCGLDEAYKEQYPSVMATFGALQYAAQQGITCFDFMGAGVPNVPYGVRDFKARFGGQEVEQGRFLYIRQPWLYRLGKMGVRWLKKGQIK